LQEIQVKWKVDFFEMCSWKQSIAKVSIITKKLILLVISMYIWYKSVVIIIVFTIDKILAFNFV
jgi:hypothetical protein